MTMPARALALLALFAAAAVSAEYVLDLKDSDFDDKVNAEEIILVEFFAPWCGHCKRLAPEYEIAAKELLQNDPPVKLAKVDATEQKAVAGRFGISGYPTLKVFRHGQPSDYQGPRDAKGIVSYMRKQAGPASKVVNSAAEFAKFAAHGDVTVLGLFANRDGAEYQTFTKVANKLRDKFKFAETDAKELLDKFGLRRHVLVVPPEHLVSKWDVKAPACVPDSEAGLETCVYAHSLPLVGEFTEDTRERYERRGLPVVVAHFKVDYRRDPKGTNYIANRVRRVAAEYRDRVLFAIAAKEGARELEQFGLSAAAEMPVALRDARGRRFGLTSASVGGKVDEAALKNFVEDFLAGRLEPFLKSEPVPADNSGPVKTVVAKNFDEIVNDESKDVFIEFYAPWCGHCKSLAPTWEELGTKLAGAEHVVIAKMDATANDVPPPFDVQGFPTLYWSPAGHKGAPKQYSGGRSLDDLLGYVRRESSQPVNVAAGGEKKGKKGGKKGGKKAAHDDEL